ncbi:ABC transporter permease [Microvirga sp. VF16]|uniref:ABC transporter permease n=1 Tax=Microvirga sp. VF16 TaxID=2807101 RepID=UPI00193CCC32|nr:ABC transporter permease [Microvirga sp. VF16]QRM33056.1 ABC transporter permease [Microvirga sp. VF16]
MKVSLFQRATVACLYLFLLAPILLTMAMSFSNDPVIAFPPEEWGANAYVAIFGNEQFIATFGVSFVIAVSVVLLCAVTGLPAGYAIAFSRFPGRDVVLAVLTAPLLLPTIVVGLGILLLFVKLKLIATYLGLVVGHSIIALPYMVRIVVTAYKNLPVALSEAAATLGASPTQVALRVQLPLIRPAVLASSAIVFLVSFDEVVISLFLVGPRLTTLPVEVFRYVDLRADPQVAALSVILVTLSVLIVLILERTVGLARALR